MPEVAPGVGDHSARSIRLKTAGVMEGSEKRTRTLTAEAASRSHSVSVSTRPDSSFCPRTLVRRAGVPLVDQ